MSESVRLSLEEENIQLKAELKEALQEKYKAAQYGLTLLEAKQNLQTQLEEVEEKCEQLKHELSVAQKNLEEQNLFQRRISIAGLQEEEDIVSESVSRESRLRGQLRDMEIELKEVKLKFERQMTENDSLHNKNTELQRHCDDLEKQHRDLKAEVKEFKTKETQLLSEYDDLEAENLELQKTILRLKMGQVEFESARHELKRLQEENDIIHAQLEEITRLKRMTEKSLEGALESLQIERDQRHNLRKELESHVASESLHHLDSLHKDIQNVSNHSFNSHSKAQDSSGQPEDSHSNAHDNNGSTDGVCPETTPTSENQTPETTNHVTTNASPNDLFTEMKASEMATYEAALSQLEAEKAQLTRNLESTQRYLDIATSELTTKQERINGLLAQLDALMSVKSEADSEFDLQDSDQQDQQDQNFVPRTGKNVMVESCITLSPHGEEPRDASKNPQNTVRNLRRALRHSENRYSVALRQIASMQHDLWRYHERDKLNDRPELNTEERLKQELIDLQSVLEERSDEIKNLNSSLAAKDEHDRTIETKLRSVSNTINQSFGILVGIYGLVCDTISEKPNKQVIELADRANIRICLDKESPDKSVASDATTTDEPDQATVDAVSEENPSNGAEALIERTESHLDIMNHLRHVLNTFIEKYNQLSKQIQGQSNGDLEDAQKQIISLKAALLTKREQLIASRNVLKANKSAAELAMAALKERYENEKANVTNTIQGLRNELAILKEEVANHETSRSMFCRYHTECLALTDDLSRKLETAKDENRDLSNLLRRLIKEKLVLCKKLEDYELKQEAADNFYQQQQHQHQSFPSQSPHHSVPHPQSGRTIFALPISSYSHPTIPPPSAAPSATPAAAAPPQNQRSQNPHPHGQLLDTSSTPRSSPTSSYYAPGSNAPSAGPNQSFGGSKSSSSASDRYKRPSRFKRDNNT